MLDELLRKRPTDLDEFRRLVPLDLRERTDANQVKAFQEQVFDILDQLTEDLTGPTAIRAKSVV